MKTVNIDNYMRVTQELLLWRAEHEDDSPTEDRILEVLDDLWEKLSDEEIEWLNSNVFKTP